jgi:2-methylcitrate dehydratase PrpD
MPIEVTKRLAEFAVNTRYEAIPEHVLENAKLAIADSLGTVLAGTGERSVVLLRERAVEESRPGKATVFGCDMGLTASHAAFANSASAHALDFDNISLTVSGFVTTPALFALLAVAEEEGGASGRELIEAFVAGYEVEAAIARGLGVLHYAKGWHSTATLAHFGAAVAVARLLKFDVEKMRCAIGIAASEASGLRDMVGNMLKAFHIAKAARNGVAAGRLAQRGFTAHLSALEIDWGFCNAFNGKGNYDLDAMMAHLGSPYDLVDPGLVIKVYPCCGLIHSALDGVLDLVREHDVKPQQIKRARVAVHELVPPTMANDDPQTGYEGKFSTAFCVATALAERSVRLHHFTDKRVRDPTVRALMARVEMVVHPELHGYETFLQKEFSDVRLELTGGEVLERRVLRIDNRGSKGRPLTFPELREKYTDCTSAYASAKAALQAFDRLEKLESVSDVREITSLLR